MKTFLFSYTMADGSEWSFELPANGFDDAHARLLAIRQTGRVDGELHARFPTWQLPFRQMWAHLRRATEAIGWRCNEVHDLVAPTTRRDGEEE